MTLNDLERRNSTCFAFFSPNSTTLQADYVTVVEYRFIMSVKYCLPVPVFHFWPKLTHPAARSLCDSWATCTLIGSDIRYTARPLRVHLSNSSCRHAYIMTDSFIKKETNKKLRSLCIDSKVQRSRKVFKRLLSSFRPSRRLSLYSAKCELSESRRGSSGRKPQKMLR